MSVKLLHRFSQEFIGNQNILKLVKADNMYFEETITLEKFIMPKWIHSLQSKNLISLDIRERLYWTKVNIYTRYKGTLTEVSYPQKNWKRVNEYSQLYTITYKLLHT